MDEKALKKLTDLISVLAKMKAENSKNVQGFNDRLGVAKDIYTRNKKDKEFSKELEKKINDSTEEVYEMILAAQE
jgi:hypothetical protein